MYPLCVLVIASTVISFLHVNPSHGVDFSFGDVIDLLRLGRETTTDILESLDLIQDRIPGMEENGFPFVKKMEKVLKSRIAELSTKLDNYQERMEFRTMKTAEYLLNRLPVENDLQTRLRNFDSYIGQINDLYELFVHYSTSPDIYEKYTLEDFAKACVSPNTGALPEILRNIHRLIVPSYIYFNTSILVSLANRMKEASVQICNQQQSPQQLLYNLYTTIALSEIKGYTMIQFSYMLLRLYIPGSNFNEEIKLLKQQYVERTYETLRAVKSAMAFAPRDLWRCDPGEHQEDETYTELKQLFQGYIVNEVDLNGENTCRENCGYYGYTKVHSCYQNQFCSQQRTCTGKLVNCKYVDSDMWVCPSNKESSRRYEFIEYEDGRVYGQKGTCNKGTTKVDSWWRWLFWHCSYCFCYCDDHNSSSDRYFNLRQVVSDVEKNKIVTGIKLAKVNQVIHIQIQEGELLPRGAINSTSIAWKPIDAYSILDPSVKNGKDYHTIMWEQRGIDMDDLIPPENNLLTGIRFRTIGSRLNLEIRVTGFNFTSGKLIPEKSFWMSNDNTDRTELKLPNPDVPTRSILQHLPDSKMYEYLNFAPTDDIKDAAQSTVPFLDIQPVEGKPPMLMAGAGIFHKGRKGSGGFLSLKLVTYDFAPHLQTQIPTSPPVLNSNNEVQAV